MKIALLSLLALFFGAEAFSKIQSWEECKNPTFGNLTIPFYADGSFRPECAPDTLYSWQNRAKLDVFTHRSNDKLMNFDFLYTWRTPLLTEGYGDVQIRIKLKAGVVFVPINLDDGNIDKRNCQAEERNVIHVAYFTKGEPESEYILCSPEVIESWSHDTEEALQEIENERAWVLSHQAGEYDEFYFFHTEPVVSGVYNKVLDLKSHLSDRELFCDPVLTAEVCKQRHFATQNPGYFNVNVVAEKQ